LGVELGAALKKSSLFASEIATDWVTGTTRSHDDDEEDCPKWRTSAWPGWKKETLAA
jgi:hypothetical protein